MDQNFNADIDQKLFESAFKFAPIGMTLVSLEGKFLKVNQSLCDFLGYSADELLKVDFQSLTHPADLSYDLENLRDITSGKIQTYRIEKRYLHKEGRDLWALLNVSLIKNAEGAPQFFISQVQDITELKNAQQSVIYNSKMIALGEMASGIAHEINNPLTIINLNASILNDLVKMNPVDVGVMNTFIGKISETVTRISDIVTSLRRISRRSDDLHFERCSLESVIHDALALCIEKFRSRGVVLHKKIENVEVECRSVEISQVLVNLLNNAFHAVHDFENKEIGVEAYVKGDVVRIEVTDNGHGVPTNIRSKIMEPFFTTKPLGEGSGLGLSISRNIVDLHHGRLFLDPSSNRTKFVVELPLKQPEKQKAP